MSKTYRGFSREQIAQTLDHSVLKPNATMDEALAGALLAKTEQVASYCIRPMDVAFASLELTNSGVPVCSVIGFPHGTTTTETRFLKPSRQSFTVREKSTWS